MIMISAFHCVHSRTTYSMRANVDLFKPNISISRPYKFKEMRKTATISYKFPSTCSVNS